MVDLGPGDWAQREREIGRMLLLSWLLMRRVSERVRVHGTVSGLYVESRRLHDLEFIWVLMNFHKGHFSNLVVVLVHGLSMNALECTITLGVINIVMSLCM